MSRDRMYWVVGVGLLWGLMESGLGPVLKTTCSSGVTGSVLCGLSYLFIAMSFALAGGARGPLVALVITVAVKLMSGALLGLSLSGGAIANPIFAFVTEVSAFLIVVAALNRIAMGPVLKASITGIAASALAVLAFPLVKWCTGVPACLKSGTGIYLAYYYSYVAIAIAAAVSPIGMWLGSACPRWSGVAVARRGTRS